MIEAERIQVLQDKPVDPDGEYVLYWMQQSQREPANPALEYAARCANKINKPLLVAFCVTADYPDANRRHFAFMLEGLAETAKRIEKRGAGFVARLGSPPDIIAELAGRAALVVCDRGYLRHQVAWRKDLASGVDKRVVQVEGDVVVPIECASDKREWAARTIRGKINDRVSDFTQTLSKTSLDVKAQALDVSGDLDLSRWQRVLDELDVDNDVAAVARFKPGTAAARAKLTRFLRSGLVGYADARNDPADPSASELSPYLHFGQISPVEISLKVQRAKGPSSTDKEAFIEELIVRRELACNFVHFTPDYDSYQCLPEWARKTLREHTSDERPTVYTRPQLEAADTDDPYWNAAMQEMTGTGYMHNYMRMYWGKKIIEWTNTPRYAYSTALYLNNKYFLDGRDPNSYANIGWLFGLHDRAWTERPIFGKTRYMNAGGLERKFDIDKYVQWANSLCDEGSGDAR
ncbi:MAG: deoxyribodipyrimidine photo-lyase [Gammaproteobacteria bacterium]|nr:deoxyribodipyrimidine photo-lyase [Gammaproteobacteria bacterium]